jgi:hypothetical protein
MFHEVAKSFTMFHIKPKNGPKTRENVSRRFTMFQKTQENGLEAGLEQILENCGGASNPFLGLKRWPLGNPGAD